MSKDLDTSGFRHLAVARRDGRGAARPRRRRWRSRGGRRTLPLGHQQRQAAASLPRQCRVRWPRGPCRAARARKRPWCCGPVRLDYPVAACL